MTDAERLTIIQITKNNKNLQKTIFKRDIGLADTISEVVFLLGNLIMLIARTPVKIAIITFNKL
ncbi:hypothetical protein IJQ19_01725 [bacterium]|nr:hypothetical protein [bacterium]